MLAFKTRLAFMAKKSPSEFSFWAAKQLKGSMNESEAGRAQSQLLLSTRCTKTRLETLSQLVGKFIKDAFVRAWWGEA